VKREIIKIDESKCDGCGLCVPECAEGAIQIIEGKAKLVADTYCDGLGACLGHCPQAAISVEEREAEEFDKSRAASHPPKAIGRHANVIRLDARAPALSECDGGGCPGARSMRFGPVGVEAPARGETLTSMLSHWPIQLHLMSPQASQYQGRDILLAADCVPFAYPDFHRRLLADHALAIACPKLDDGQEIYVEKLAWLIERAEIKSLTVVIMEVPCCMGLLRLAQEAMVLAGRRVPVRSIVIGVRGEIVEESWLQGP
jgi:Pyruvate/2-oxoacid:ferredoxin oxidoreductase delta subunit